MANHGKATQDLGMLLQLGQVLASPLIGELPHHGYASFQLLSRSRIVSLDGSSNRTGARCPQFGLSDQ